MVDMHPRATDPNDANGTKNCIEKHFCKRCDKNKTKRQHYSRHKIALYSAIKQLCSFVGWLVGKGTTDR